MILNYTIKFYDYWHLGSGLSAGAKLDSTVVKDKDSLPYVPGKTVKGLAREMAELLSQCEFINACFGGSSDEKDKCYDEKAKNKQGKCYFSNATMEDSTAKEILNNHLQDNLYDVIASTKIGKKGTKNETEGIAVDDSLREIEVVLPLALKGTIEEIPSGYEVNIKKSLKMIKRVGLNRNRGLGRCEFIIGEVS